MPTLPQARTENFFASPFLLYHLPDGPALNAQLRASILDHELRHTSEALTNRGGWHSETGALAFCGAAGQRLLHHVHNMVAEATDRLYAECGQSTPPLQWTLSAWANVNRRGAYNAMHTHPGATWSGVYFVDSGRSQSGAGGTALQFADPCPTRTNIFFPDLSCANISFEPEPGLMILFPSYLPHTVLPHEGDHPRISVAFNVRKDPFP